MGKDLSEKNIAVGYANGESFFFLWKKTLWGQIFAHPLFLRYAPYRVLKWGKHPADVVKNSHPKHVMEK